MKLKRVSLNNYRNYSDIVVDFNDNLNIIIGNNAQGKTNLLESIYVLAVTKSFLSNNDIIYFSSVNKKIRLFSNKTIKDICIKYFFRLYIVCNNLSKYK